MTFIAVNMKKIDETIEWVIYAFGNPPQRVLGHVKIYKADGKIEIVDIINDKYKKHLLPCVIKKLSQHYEKGEYPETTTYAA